MDVLSREFEKALIAKALARTGGRRIEAANLLGMGRNTITRKIAELGTGTSGGRVRPTRWPAPTRRPACESAAPQARAASNRRVAGDPLSDFHNPGMRFALRMLMLHRIK